MAWGVKRVRVGTSGYSYGWNKGKPSPFAWYVGQGFDTVEINASFYRFPTKGWVDTWVEAPDDFVFSIKVHRSITHYCKLMGNAMSLWKRFREPLIKMDDKIAFWLFQMPPLYMPTEGNVRAVESFLNEWEARGQPVFEFREGEWWDFGEALDRAGAVFCSVDAPGLPRDVVAMNGSVYLRLHGRGAWYSYVYNEQELDEIAERVSELEAQRSVIYLNNDHGMLPNGLHLLKLYGSRVPNRADIP